MKGVTSNRTMRFIVGSLPGLAITLGIAPAHAASAACPPAVALRPRLHADATMALPRGTVLVRLDPATGSFVPIRNAHIRAAGLYKIVPRGASGALPPAPPPPPTTLPATGGNPFGALLALAAALFGVGWWLLGRVHTARRHPPS